MIMSIGLRVWCASFFLVAVILPVSSLWAQKARELSVVVDDVVEKLNMTSTGATPLRLAVVPLANTQSRSFNKFGEYATESIISKLSGNTRKFKIFERKRLDAIIKEDELMLSDLMLPEAAQKLGKLVPIDALLSGTYTKLKSYIDINARLLDVSTGEIIVSFSERVKMTRNLKSLFVEGAEGTDSPTGLPVVVKGKEEPVSNQPVANQRSSKEICDQLEKEFKVKLNDLSSPEKIKTVAHDAMGVPFDLSCGKIHFGVMYSFGRYKVKVPEYESFLLATVDTIAFPSQDERAYEVFRFLTRDSLVTDREWRSGIHAISKIGDYTISSYLNFLLARTKSPEQELHDRIEAYFKLANDRKIGLPQPIPFNVTFFEMMEALKSNQPLRQYVYQNFAGGVVLDTRSASTIYSELHSMYAEENNPGRKTEIIRWIADYFNSHADEKSHEHLYDMARSFELTLNDQRNKEIQQQFPEADLARLVELTRAKFSEYAMKTPYQSQQEDRINLCVKYSVPVPGVIPTMPEAEKILQGSDINEQLRIMKLIVQMGDRPKLIEGSMIKLFSRRSLDDRDKLTEIQSLAMVALGHIKTSNQQAIDYMTSKIASFNYQESDNASGALVEIGKPAVVPLIKLLDKTSEQDGGLRYKIVVLLGKIGSAAKPAEGSLKKLLASNSNADIRYAIEAALEAIK